MSRSSTSSSEVRPSRWPVAGAIAVVLLLAIDVLSFRIFSPWRAFDGRLDGWYHEDKLRDRLAIDALGRDAAKRTRAIVMGTSRMQQAWRPRLLDAPLPDDLEVFELAHARIYPTELRAAAAVMRDRAPDVVVLGVSELDTHVPVMLDRRTSYPDATLYVEAARHLGAGWLFDNRREFYRVVVGGAVAAYRHRGLLGDAGLDRLRRFDLPNPPLEPVTLTPLEEEIAAEFEARDTNPRRHKWRMNHVVRQVRLVGRVARGPHADAQQQFLVRAVETFRSAGSRVVIFELPLYPSARKLYDAEFRADFLALVAGLEVDPGVRVIRLEDQPEYERSDFKDITHVGSQGAAKTSRVILDAILDARS